MATPTYTAVPSATPVGQQTVGTCPNPACKVQVSYVAQPGQATAVICYNCKATITFPPLQPQPQAVVVTVPTTRLVGAGNAGTTILGNGGDYALGFAISFLFCLIGFLIMFCAVYNSPRNIMGQRGSIQGFVAGVVFWVLISIFTGY